MAANPLLPSEIETWCRLCAKALTPWEARLIFRIDAAVLATVSEKEPGAEAPEKPPAAAVSAKLSTAFAVLEARDRKASRKSPL